MRCIDYSTETTKCVTEHLLQIDKVGEAERSPNLADAVVMAYVPRQMPMVISPAMLENL